MALNLDKGPAPTTPALSAAPLEAEPPPPPPRKLAKELVGNESATGPELPSVPKPPGVEVIAVAGEEGRRRLPEGDDDGDERSSRSQGQAEDGE